MGRAAIAVLILLGGCWAAVGEEVAPPPSPLHKVNDHWTPWEPPTEFPPDAEVYIIEPGDTLWDLATEFYGDPYLWPQLWERNQYIRDAHWIYPGDPLVIGPKPGEMEPEEVVPEPVAEPPAEEVSLEEVPLEAELGPLVAVGSEDDVYCFAYLDETDENSPLQVIGGEEKEYKDMFATGDIVYVSGGEEEGVTAGQEYFVVRAGRDLYHPATTARMGRVMLQVGHLRILCTHGHSATAEILNACDGIELDDQLLPFEAIPIPMTVLTPPVTRCDPANEEPKGYILYSEGELYAFGQGHMVLLDLGEADQAAAGTVCTIYRDDPAPEVERLVLGELAVLRAGDRWSTGKVLFSSGPLRIGDRVEIK